MPNNAYHVLYFIKGPAPSDEQRRDALQYGPHCKFRNSLYVDPNTALTALETCMAVAGLVPMCYARAYPQAVSIGEYYDNGLPRLPMAVVAGLETPSQALEGLRLPGQTNEPDFGAIDMPVRPPGEAVTAIEPPPPPTRRGPNKGRGVAVEGPNGTPEWTNNA